jgi:tetratricopeptide (TPR) repeat protein
MHLLDSEQTGLAISQLECLTTPGRDDHAPARIWLARQALSDKPVIPLTSEQIEGHLLMALEKQPRNLIAKRLIGEVLLRKGHLKAAEDHFLDVVADDPTLAFSLAKIQSRLGRSAEQIKFHLDVAIDFFQQRLMKNPQLVTERIRLSECLVLADRQTDAERVLSEGLGNEGADSEELREAFSKYYVDLAANRLRESLLNRDLCAGIVGRAITLDPSNRKALKQALTLNSLGPPLMLRRLHPLFVQFAVVRNCQKLIVCCWFRLWLHLASWILRFLNCAQWSTTTRK